MIKTRDYLDHALTHLNQQHFHDFKDLFECIVGYAIQRQCESVANLYEVKYDQDNLAFDHACLILFIV